MSLTLALAALIGLLVAAVNDGAGPLSRPEFRFITTLPPAVYPVLAIGTMTAVLLRHRWWLGLLLFFAWIPFEDLVRKFANNDLRVYFVKDVLLAVAIFGALPYLRGRWRSSLGETWLPLMAVFTFALVMALPAIVNDPSQPLAAFQTRFLFAVLLPVGAHIAGDRKLLESVLFWLSVLMAAVCVLGVIQAVVGPTFLNPAEAPSTLAHLTVERTEGSAVVLRPSGPFTDVSRFAAFTVTSTAMGLAAAIIAATKFRQRLALTAVVISCLGAFASGSRASVIVTSVLVTLVVLNRTRRKTQALVRLAVAVAVLALAASSVGGRAGATVRATADFLNSTLNPSSANFQLGPRVIEYGNAIVKTVSSDNRLGRGTGVESPSNQYRSDTFAVTDTESGWRSVAAEWGILGLVAWVVWTFVWLRRAFRSAPARQESPVESVRFVIALYLALFLLAQFSLGIGTFENYAANVFFWFLSGMVFRRQTPIERMAKAHSLAAAELAAASADSSLSLKKQLTTVSQ